MRTRLMTLGLLLLAACSSGDDGSTGPGGSSEVTLVGGQVVCDSCESVRIVLGGPGIAGVRSATLVTSDVARTTLPARIIIDRESGASGDQLVLTVFFDQGVPEGQFDLWLDPLTAGDAARVVPAALRVTRARPGPGTLATLRVWVQVTGVDRDMRYTFRTVAGCDTTVCPPIPVEPYDGVTRPMEPGAYTFQLDDVAENCTVTGAPNPATVTLQRGVSTALGYRLTCGPVANPGWVRVTNVTTGVDLDDAYQVSCSGLDCRAFTLAANRDTVLRLAPGQLSVGFADVAQHCSLTSPSPVPLTVNAGDTVTATFAVTCRELPSIRVSVQTTGRRLDDTVRVFVCPSAYYDPCRSEAVSSNGEVTFSGLRPDRYGLYLGDIAENCGVTGPNRAEVELQGSAVPVAFQITCQEYATVRVSAVLTGTNQDNAYRVVHDIGCYYWYYVCPSNRCPHQASWNSAPCPDSSTSAWRTSRPTAPWSCQAIRRW